MIVPIVAFVVALAIIGVVAYAVFVHGGDPRSLGEDARRLMKKARDRLGR